MKKLFFILTVATALIALELVFPKVQVEEQVASFLKTNISRVVNWVNFGALA